MNRSARRRLLWVLALALLAIATVVILLLPAPGQGISTGPLPLTYVGSRRCEECHAEEAERARGSHHDLAMQPANAESVLGDFSDPRFSYAGTSSRFYRKGDGFFVRTDGPNGRLTDYRIAYTFGVEPLQQYLVEMRGGRYQALSIAWDSRPRKQGGQRWFHLYPSGSVNHRDVRHWTRPAQNWNSQCAECHSTNLSKGYRPSQDRFDTTFSESGVSCEACHGPGSRHANWAESARARGRQPSGDPGLVVRFNERRSRTWEMDLTRGTARPTKFLEERSEVETCARCHARRAVLSEDYQPGRPLTETHRPALLDQGLYYADGQMRGEVYEWGSFLESRMYAVGITCADCHDPHDQKVKIGRDAVCSSCHKPERFATRRHHFHRENGKGASCVACHMRSETYLVVQARHDHSLRVPRPDLTVKLGAADAPNACNDCHKDETARWAAQAVKRWYPEGRSGRPHYAEAFSAARRHEPGAERALLAAARNATLPGIVRGTAVSMLPSHMSPASFPVIQKAATDADVLVRLGAAAALEALPAGERLRAGVSLLWDAARAVRVEAVVAFADVPDSELASEQRAAFDRALDEYLLAQRANAERPEARVNLGIVYAKRGRLAEARKAYDDALRIAPWFVPAYLNLADLLRAQGRDEEGEVALRKALRVDSSSAPVHHALGLLLARRKRQAEALLHLARAFELDPGDPQFAQVYAVSLSSAGRVREALDVLRAARRRSPGAREILVQLVAIHRDRGDRRQARAWAERLLEAVPDDPQAQALAAALEVEEELPSP